MSSTEMNILNSNNVRKTESNYWLGLPSSFLHYYATGCYVDSTTGGIYDSSVGSSYGVRPSISLISGIEYAFGNGSMENPYYVGELYNITNSNNLFMIKKKSPSGYEVQIYSDDLV